MVLGMWFACATLVTILLLLILRRRNSCITNLPSGSLGLPIAGETLHMLMDMEGFYEQRLSRYGDIFKTHIYGCATVVSMNAELNKFILMNEGKMFISNFPESLHKIFGEWNMSKLSGVQHKRRRGIVLGLSRMTAANEKSLLRGVEGITKQYLRSWHGRILHVQDETEKITFAIICNLLISMVSAEEVNKLKKDFSELNDGILSFGYNIPGTAFWKAMKARKRIIHKLHWILQRRRSATASPASLDVLDTLLDAVKTGEIDKAYTTEEILDFLMGILFAAYETTATTMTMAVKFLTSNARALREIRNEHARIKKAKQPGAMLTWKDYEMMTFTQNVIDETLRLSSPTPILHRRAIQNVTYKGITIPKGWKILVHNAVVHKNSSMYPDPSKFNPWRWQNHNGNECYFAPFGYGIRHCPGDDLAKLKIAVFLHHLVTHYSWEPKEGKKQRYFPNVTKQTGIYVLAKEMDSQHL
ncbi:hypothetical protein O6H91_12G079000 [Diphasiastrum complanatum]|uniref:Uncharacterized protein n=1 Tax=Diphasiastrum complanatum TaxID=34168 RepID=A0ACC2C3Z1_DIPCM|nr:hypothetical protein O6H91_12G079000 [Diphasiastrum complanatum]